MTGRRFVLPVWVCMAVTALCLSCSTGDSGPVYDRASFKRALLGRSDVPTGFRLRPREGGETVGHSQLSKQCRRLADVDAPSPGKKPIEQRQTYRDSLGRTLVQTLWLRSGGLADYRAALARCDRMTVRLKSYRYDVRIHLVRSIDVGSMTFAFRIVTRVDGRQRFTFSAYVIVFSRGNAVSQVAGASGVDQRFQEVRLPDSVVERMARKADAKLRAAA